MNKRADLLNPQLPAPAKGPAEPGVSVPKLPANPTGPPAPAAPVRPPAGAPAPPAAARPHPLTQLWNATGGAPAQQSSTWNNLMSTGKRTLMDAYLTKVPPLQHLLGEAGVQNQTVNKALGWVQNNVTPQNFAQIAGAVPGVGSTLTALPGAIGAPVMAGLYGMLRGGESGGAAVRLFQPLLNKVKGLVS